MIPRIFNIRKFLKLSLLIFCFFFLLNSYNAIPIADDYCLHFNAQNQGLWKFVTDFYFNWTGRFLTIFTWAVLTKFIPIEHINLVSVFFSFCFLILINQLSKLINLGSNSKVDQYVILAFMAAVMWFAYRTVIGRIVIWFGGGIVYIMYFALLSFFFLEFIKCYQTKRYSWRLIIACLILANSVELIPPAMIFFMGAYVLFNSKIKEKESLKFIFILALIITLASIPLYLAPGNFARARTINTTIGISLNTLMYSYFDVANFFLISAQNVILMTLPLALLSSFMLEESTRNTRRMIGFCLFAAAIGSALPMGFVPQHNGSRAASLFVFLSGFGLMAIGSSAKFNFRLDRNKTIVASVLFIIVSTFIAFDISRGIKLRKHFIQRHEFLKTKVNSNEDVVVTSFKGKSPRSLNNHSLNSYDKTYWVNVCIAKYYRLKSYRVEDK